MLTDEDDQDHDNIMQASQRDGVGDLNNTYAEFDENGNPLPNMTREEYDSEEDNSPKGAQ